MLNHSNYSIDDKTRDEVIDLLNQVVTKLALPPNMPIAGRNYQNMGQASVGYVKDCLAAARQFPTIPSGEINVANLEAKLVTIANLDAILGVTEPLQTNTLNLRRLTGQEEMAASNSIRKSIEEAANTKAEVKATYIKLKQRYARMSAEQREAAKLAREQKAAEKAAEKQG